MYYRMNGPWILINWPNFNAAPRIWVSFATSLRMLASDMNTEGAGSEEETERRSISPAAPYPREAARPYGRECKREGRGRE